MHWTNLICSIVVNNLEASIFTLITNFGDRYEYNPAYVFVCTSKPQSLTQISEARLNVKLQDSGELSPLLWYGTVDIWQKNMFTLKASQTDEAF